MNSVKQVKVTLQWKLFDEVTKKLTFHRRFKKKERKKRLGHCFIFTVSIKIIFSIPYIQNEMLEINQVIRCKTQFLKHGSSK